MKKIVFLTSAILFLNAFQLIAQAFEVPPNFQLSVKEDYARYEKDIIAAEKWLVATPINEATDKRKAAGAFVFQWVSGSPTVNCDVTAIVVDFEKKNPGMLIVYMAATARYVLENNYTKDREATHRAALARLIGFYKANQDLKKDKKMEKLTKADADGKMEEWLKENFKIENQ